MKRRDFLFLLPVTLFLGCSFEYTPYSANPKKRALNRKNIEQIIAKSSDGLENFKVAVVSDTHTYYEDFKKVINSIKNRNDIDFVLHCGDLTDSGILKEFEWAEEILSSLFVPFVAVVGNHDALANGRGVYMEMFGYFNFNFSYNGTYFYVFNNNNWEFSSEAIDYEWLESELASAPLGANKIVACHISPFDHARFDSTEKDRFHELMQKYGVQLVINGHDHNHKIITKDATQYVTIGSVNKSSFVVLDISSTDITVENINV